MKKRILKLVKIGLVLGLLSIILLYVYILNAWKLDYTTSDISKLISQIQQAEALPEQFYTLYNVEFEQSLENSIAKQTWRSLISNTYKPSISHFVSRFYYHGTHFQYHRNVSFVKLSLALELEQRTTKRELLNWDMSTIDFLHNQHGIASAACFYFDKTLTALSDKELATLVVMSKNTSLYNPIRRPQLVAQKVEQLLEKTKGVLMDD